MMFVFRRAKRLIYFIVLFVTNFAYSTFPSVDVFSSGRLLFFLELAFYERNTQVQNYYIVSCLKVKHTLQALPIALIA